MRWSSELRRAARELLSVFLYVTEQAHEIIEILFGDGGQECVPVHEVTIGSVMGDDRSPAHLAQGDGTWTALVHQLFRSGDEPFPCRACLCDQHQEKCRPTG